MNDSSHCGQLRAENICFFVTSVLHWPIRILCAGYVVTFISGPVLTAITVNIKNVFGPTNTCQHVLSLDNF